MWFPSLGGVVPAIAVIVALGIGAGAIALLGHHTTAAGPNRDTPATKPVSRRTTSTSTTLPARMHQLQGRPIVITVWATWCSPCRNDLAIASSVAARDDHTIAFIAADYMDRQPAAQTYLRQHHITLTDYPTSDLQPLVPARLQGVPTTIFLNANGNVTRIHLGDYSTASALADDVNTYAVSSHQSTPTTPVPPPQSSTSTTGNSGDPASDVLANQSLFLPADAGVAPAQQARLARMIASATRAGFGIRVAIIASKSDLGSVTALWRRPQAYADFLGQELSLVNHGPLLVVMPNGFGFYQSRSGRAADQAQLGNGAPLTKPSDLAAPAADEVQRLAAASGHPTH
jgi:thiol-disulfide isomerase/thioredoxin